MKTNSYSSSKIKENFEKFLGKSFINRIGKSSGFSSRKAQKITAFHFVAGFIGCCCKQVNTFSNWAAQIAMISNQGISKQAVFKRLYSSAAVTFVRQLLEHVIVERSRGGINSSLFKGFGKVLLQDSTTLRLVDSLASAFKGNITEGKQKSQVRIQTVLNVKTMRFLQFSLAGFTKNDQSASRQILADVSKGDLIIRDLGYFVLDVFKDIIEAKVHFLSRLKYGILLFHPDGGPIKILSLLKDKAIIDMQVCIGKQRIPVRLVMLRLPKAQAAERVRKAKYNRDKSLNHTKDYYRLLAYAVYVTSVDEETWDARQVGDAYRVRWQIEIIFKSWKSYGRMQEMLQENITTEQRVSITIYLYLLFICLIINNLYVLARQKIEKQHQRYISILKFIGFIFNNFYTIILLPPNQLMKLIADNCCYERRKDRLNMIDLYLNNKN